MTVKAHSNKNGVRWFRCGGIKLVLHPNGAIHVGRTNETSSSTAFMDRASTVIPKADIDDLDEALTYVQRVRKDDTPPLVVDNGWRTAAADAIREGRDHEAFTIICENTPTISATMTAERKLTFGELMIGEHFVCWPISGDNNGHGGFLGSHRMFTKTAMHVGQMRGSGEAMNGSGIPSAFPESMAVIKLVLT